MESSTHSLSPITPPVTPAPGSFTLICGSGSEYIFSLSLHSRWPSYICQDLKIGGAKISKFPSSRKCQLVSNSFKLCFDPILLSHYKDIKKKTIQQKVSFSSFYYTVFAHFNYISDTNNIQQESTLNNILKGKTSECNLLQIQSRRLVTCDDISNN